MTNVDILTFNLVLDTFTDLATERGENLGSYRGWPVSPIPGGDISTTSLMFHESTREEVMVMAEGESLILVLPRTLCGLLRFPVSLSL